MQLAAQRIAAHDDRQRDQHFQRVFVHPGKRAIAEVSGNKADKDAATCLNGEQFREAYSDYEIPSGGYFNPFYPSLVIGMAPPLNAGQVTYEDGTEATVSQMAQDVAAFLTWAGEPSMIKRKQTGWPVIGFLIFLTILAFMAKKQVWADAKPVKRKD